TPIDGTYLAAELPDLTVLSEEKLGEFLAAAIAGCTLYIELGFQIDLASLVLPTQAHGQRVAVVPPGASQTEWHDWAEKVVPGVETHRSCPVTDLWRSNLTGQVFDSASLNTVWYELTHGAYGDIQRAKGIFTLEDGRTFYFGFTAGCSLENSIELEIPRWGKGRPEHFSGIEILGAALHSVEIAATLKESCLDDQAIAYYQEQRQNLLEQEEKIV
ncbi:MAG: GTP-binding protein, partial [Leptolyngbyaceae bacterium]|nr:GTP-binding protein [Leptolyngbyaceae bacterium]